MDSLRYDFVIVCVNISNHRDIDTVEDYYETE